MIRAAHLEVVLVGLVQYLVIYCLKEMSLILGITSLYCRCHHVLCIIS